VATYRPPRRYLRRYRHGSMPSAGQAVLAVVVAAALAGVTGHTVTARAGTHHHHGSPARTAAVAQAISYTRHRLGLPYCWGGTGPSCYDCSGLMEQAYGFPSSLRTSEDQFAGLPHVPFGQQRPGDLVFFAGSDGTVTAPGHVGMVLSKRWMIEAYATGFPIRISQYGTPASAPGDTNPVGFARPGRA
jgi:cell wall-associated NlpC family hydrolase